MRNYELMTRLENQEEVYFENTFDEVVFKSTETGYEAKRKNGEPFKIEIGASILTEAFLEGKIISKDEYDKY